MCYFKTYRHILIRSIAEDDILVRDVHYNLWRKFKMTTDVIIILLIIPLPSIAATLYNSPFSLGHKHQTLSWASIHSCHNSEHQTNPKVSVQLHNHIVKTSSWHKAHANWSKCHTLPDILWATWNYFLISGNELLKFQEFQSPSILSTPHHTAVVLSQLSIASNSTNRLFCLA